MIEKLQLDCALVTFLMVASIDSVMEPFSLVSIVVDFWGGGDVHFLRLMLLLMVVGLGASLPSP